MKQQESPEERETTTEDTEFSSELTEEEHAVHEVKKAIFDMYSEEGYYNKDKE